MTKEPPRPAEQRKRDTLARFGSDVDAWVASADLRGNPYLVPLSYVWDGTALIMATPEASPTARNLAGSGRVRLAVGATRDVVMVEGAVEVFSRESVPAVLAEAFAARLWDARRGDVRFAYLRITPQRIQAWREGNEIRDRDLMRAGRWLV